MKLKVYTPDGTSSSEKDFAIPEYEGDKGLKALRQALIAAQANSRQGTASAKTRAEVAGSGKKPWRQKGTGMARSGSRRSPIWRHGGIIHPPKPRDWSQKITRKMKRLAFCRAIFDRAAVGEIDVIERFEVPERKTKHFNAIINNIAPGGRILVVDEAWADDVALSARNIERVRLADARDLNALDVSGCDKILISEKGINAVLGRVNGESQS